MPDVPEVDLSQITHLNLFVPRTTVGVIIVSRNDEGGLDAHWQEAADVVLPEREHLGRALRMLADAIEAEEPAGLLG